MRIGRTASASTRVLLRHREACEALRFSCGTREAGAGIASQAAIRTANGTPYCENFMVKQQLLLVWDEIGGGRNSFPRVPSCGLYTHRGPTEELPAAQLHREFSCALNILPHVDSTAVGCLA